jgi:hypothetical protein
MHACQPIKNHLERLAKILAIGCGLLLLSLAIIIGLAIRGKLAFDKVMVHAHERMEKLGGGATNGRRTAESYVHVWSHDTKFDAVRLTEAMQIIRELDNNEDVTRIYLDFWNSGVTDEDVRLLQGLRKLKSIDLSRTKVTPKGISDLLKLYPDVEINTNDFRSKLLTHKPD